MGRPPDAGIQAAARDMRLLNHGKRIGDAIIARRAAGERRRGFDVPADNRGVRAEADGLASVRRQANSSDGEFMGLATPKHVLRRTFPSKDLAVAQADEAAPPIGLEGAAVAPGRIPNDQTHRPLAASRHAIAPSGISKNT